MGYFSNGEGNPTLGADYTVPPEAAKCPDCHCLLDDHMTEKG